MDNLFHLKKKHISYHLKKKTILSQLAIHEYWRNLPVDFGDFSNCTENIIPSRLVPDDIIILS